MPRAPCLVLGLALGLDLASAADGDLQLVNGQTIYDGILQVEYSGVWGTVCDDLFGDAEAEVACQQLFGTGFESYATDDGSCYTAVDASMPIFMDSVICDGSESKLSDCVFDGWGTSDCSHSEDVSLVCSWWPHSADAPTTEDLTCVPSLCGEGYKECSEGGLSWCCDENSNYPDCGDSWGYCQEEGLSKKQKKTIVAVLVTIVVVFFGVWELFFVQMAPAIHPTSSYVGPVLLPHRKHRRVLHALPRVPRPQGLADRQDGTHRRRRPYLLKKSRRWVLRRLRLVSRAGVCGRLSNAVFALTGRRAFGAGAFI